MRRLPGRRRVPFLEPRKEATAATPITRLLPPEVVTIPLRQHIGQTCEPAVRQGDRVRVGQLLGETPERLAAPVHASVSGTVVEVADRPYPLGGRVPAVVIENDGLDEEIDPIRLPEPESATPEQLRAAVRRAGIVGMAGAAFPTAVKLDPPPGTQIDTVIINVMEGEPYLSADHRVALEHAEEVTDGLHWIMRMVGASRGVLAVEEDKEDAALVLERELASAGLDSVAEVLLLPRDYAAGAEKILIKLVLGREVPSGSLPYDVGAVSQNVSSTLAISRAVREGRPLVERVMTVAGGAAPRPGNYLVRLGSSFEHVLKEVGVENGHVDRVVMGGPMMGVAQGDTSAPVIKATTGVLALRANESRQAGEIPCIHCAWCVEVCPIGLMPFLLVDLIRADESIEATAYHLFDCFECGLCDFVCPSNIPLVEVIRAGKANLRESQT